jgi:radical SAM protein with 4Fe4S-binding SPASM domain
MSLIDYYNGKFVSKLHLDEPTFDALQTDLNIVLENALKQQKLSEENSGIVRELQKGVFDSEISRGLSVTTGESFKGNHQELVWLLKNPKDRWVEYLIYRYKSRLYPSRQKRPNFPPYLLIEPTSVCNIRCVMCYQVDKTFTTKDFMGNMSWDLFTKAVDEASENNCPAITMASRGEPTLHPQLGEMLSYIASKGFLDLKLNTNATLLNDELSRKILNAGVNEVVFSVDAGTKETYEKIRVLGKFDEVVQNVKRFQEIRDNEYKDSKTVTRISGVKVDDDQDIDQMVSFWEPLVDEVVIKPASPKWDFYNNDLVNASSPCSVLWERLYVWYDGTLNPCDFDYKSVLSIGNLNDMSLTEAWNSEPYHQLREKHANGEGSSIYPCDRCPWINS